MAKRKYFNDLEFAEQSSKSLTNSEKSNYHDAKLKNAIDNSFIKTELCLFDLLPDEILEHLCSFLPIKTLIVLEELKCGRLSDSALKTHFINFSSCNDIHIEDIEKIFCAERSHYVKKINFYHVFLVHTSSLLKATIKCKHLSYLSVIGCGFQLKEITQVLLKCQQLEELHWNVTVKDRIDWNGMDTSHVNIKHLYLYLNNLGHNHLSVVCYLIQRCQSATSILINTSTLQDSTFLLLNQTVSHGWHKFHKHLSCPTKILLSFLSKWTIGLSVKIKKMGICCPNNENQLALAETAPYLQLLTSAEDFVLLDKTEFKTLREIFLCVTNNEFLDRNIDKLKQVMGRHTKLLSMVSLPAPEVEEEDIYRASDIAMSNLIERLVWNCCNIAHLIIKDVHFGGKFNFEALHILTGLKTLNLTSCVFCHDRSCRVKLLNQKQQESFELMVKTCKEVQNFTLSGCCICESGPCDADLDAVPLWPNLQSVSLNKLKHMCFCPFLAKLPHSCPQLKSLQVLGVGLGLMCQYLPNVMLVLAHSPKLLFLSVNVDSIQVKSSRFWKSVASSKTLQGICVIGISNTSICAKHIVDAVKESACLHLFHYNSPNVPESLEGKIWRAMRSNGIKQAKVATTLDVRFSDFNCKPCIHPHFSVDSLVV